MSGLFFLRTKMPLELENKVAGFIEANRLFDSADKVLLAVSGGADSTALLYTMCALRTAGVLKTDFVCAHINHQLRGSEADTDEDFVITQARSLELPIVTKRVDVRRFARKNKLSIETAARKLRIESLLNIAKANNCDRIATAHQKDDNAETVLQRLSRGTGFRGLGGIWPARVFADEIRFVRPLLCVRRDEIIRYLKQRNLKWRVDRTNAVCTYRRNFIRHRLIPALQVDCTGSIVEQLSELAQSARRSYSLVCSISDRVWPEIADCGGDKVTLDLKRFQVEPEPVKVELVRQSLACLGSGERDLTQAHYKKILQLAQQNTNGRKITLPNAFMARREYGKLIFTKAQRSYQPDKQIGKSVKLEVPGQTRFGRHLIEAGTFEVEVKQFEAFKAHKSSFIERFDLDKVILPLGVRFRKAGDRFVPLGLASEKKIGKFLTAAKVPLEIREKTLIVADSEKIIWLWPIRISEQAKVTSGTRKILQLQITDTEPTQ